MSLQQTLRFTGKFTDLIPSGWTFHKLFARNYRCYFYPVNGEYGDHMVIWQAGRFIEFPLLNEESSAALMHFLFTGVVFSPYSSHVTKVLGLTGLAPLELVYDEQTNEFEIMAEEDRWTALPNHQRKYTLSSEFAGLVMKWYNDKFFEFSA